MKLDLEAYKAKYRDRFADNDTFNITPLDLREFSDDTADSFGPSVPNVPYYVAGVSYAEGYLVRYVIPGTSESFFVSRQAGQLPAPTSSLDANWRVVPGPVPATQLGQFITLDEASGLWGNGVVHGRRYGIVGLWNAGTEPELVEVDGCENYFRRRGTLLRDDGTQQEVDADVLTGTYVAAGNGSGGASTFAQLGGQPSDNQALATTLASKADLGPDGLIPLSQVPQVIELDFSFPAGQTTTQTITISSNRKQGQYVISQSHNVSSYTFYKNGVQVVVTNELFVLNDVLDCAGTVPGGSERGYLILEKQ